MLSMFRMDVPEEQKHLSDLDRATIMMYQGVTERPRHLCIWNGFLVQCLASASEFHNGLELERNKEVARTLRMVAVDEFEIAVRQGFIDC
jgi:hypothetical protein